MRKKITATLFSACAVVYFWCVFSTPVFLDFANRQEVYSNACSSQASISNVDNRLCFTKFFRRGEAVIIDYEKFNAQLNEQGKITQDSIINIVNVFLEKFNASVVFLERLEHGISVYAYSQNINYLTVIKGKKINLHLFFGECIKVGSPIILGSY